MGIESMSGAVTAGNVVQPSQTSQQSPQANQVRSQPVEPVRNERVQLQAKETQEISAERLEAAINKINEMMKSSQRSLNFSVDKTSDQVVVQVRDMTTDKVVRQIPNAEALRFAESFDRLMGVIFDETT